MAALPTRRARIGAEPCRAVLLITALVAIASPMTLERWPAPAAHASRELTGLLAGAAAHPPPRRSGATLGIRN